MTYRSYRHVGITLPDEAWFVMLGGLTVYKISYTTLATGYLKLPTAVSFSSRRVDTVGYTLARINKKSGKDYCIKRQSQ